MEILKERAAEYLKAPLGFAFFLAWDYVALFSCALAQTPRGVLGSLEQIWMLAGLAQALAGLVALFLARRSTVVSNRWFGVCAVLCSVVGSFFIWLVYLRPALWFLFPLGSVFSGVSVCLMGVVWGSRLSALGEELIEFSVPASFVVAFAAYFFVVFTKQAAVVTVLLLTVMAAVSMFCAYREEGMVHALSPWSVTRNKAGSGKAARRQCLLVAVQVLLLWTQIAFFRSLTTPLFVSNRFFHYLLPFSCALVLAVAAFFLCLRFAKSVDFSLMVRWGVPLLLLCYPVLYLSPLDANQRVIAYAVNFIGMFGVQLGCWVSIPKTARYAGHNPVLITAAVMTAEGLGIFIGTAAYRLAEPLFGIEGLLVPALFVVALMCCLSMGLLSPRLQFPAVLADETQDETLSENLEQIFAERAEDLQREYGLTARETEVAALLLAGRSRPYIREKLTISLNTVHTHARNIMIKCGVHSQRDLIDLVMR